VFVDYYVRIKRAEIARAAVATKDQDAAGVTDWEHKEYFDMP